MSSLIALWLPILLSAVAVFIISSLVHMVLKWHAADYKPLPNEDAVRDAIRAGNPTPGRYVTPHCGDMKDMSSEPMKKKYGEGPVAHFTILPNGQPNMGKYLGMWFLLCLLVSAVTAFIVVRLVAPSIPLGAAKLAFAVSFIAYGFGTLQESIWMGRPWVSSVKYLFDSLLYALGTAAVFYFCWPK